LNYDSYALQNPSFAGVPAVVSSPVTTTVPPPAPVITFSGTSVKTPLVLTYTWANSGNADLIGGSVSDRIGGYLASQFHTISNPACTFVQSSIGSGRYVRSAVRVTCSPVTIAASTSLTVTLSA
jgi:hypothetical protein